MRSLKSFAPALSSMEFSFRFMYSRVLLSFRAWERYLDPSYPIELLLRFRLIRILLFIKNFDSFRAP